MIIQAWTKGISYSLWRIDALARPTGSFTLLARRLGHPFGQSAAQALGGAMLPASCSKQLTGQPRFGFPRLSRFESCAAVRFANGSVPRFRFRGSRIDSAAILIFCRNTHVPVEPGQAEGRKFQQRARCLYGKLHSDTRILPSRPSLCSLCFSLPRADFSWASHLYDLLALVVPRKLITFLANNMSLFDSGQRVPRKRWNPTTQLPRELV